MKMNKQFFTILIVIVGVLKVFAQDPPADITFFNPTYGSASQTLNPSAGTGDDSQTFIDAINAVNSAGGGKVIVNAGTYRILEVPLKSNVHLELDSGVTLVPINPSTTSNNAIFDADSNAGIENFSIIGTGGNFTVDMTTLVTTIRIRVISFKYCSNFKVSNFHITDNYTEFSSLAFGSNYGTTSTPDGTRINLIRGVPHHGIIENISMVNGHYGYGLVQTQGGNNLLFRDLSCVGGVALRLETGFNLLQYTELYDFNDIKLDQIWGRNLECTNGQSALQLSPHTLDQGFFDVSGVTGVSCEAGVVWSSGFTTDEQESFGLTPGTFDTTSKIRNVISTFGQNAQLHHVKRLRYIPCALRVERVGGIGIATTLNVDGESRMGPAIGAVLKQEDRPGHYDLDFPVTEVTANGYNIEAYYLPPNAIFRDSYDDYEICDESIDGISFWITADERDTPNPRNPLENGTLSINEFSDSEFNVYPNPTNGLLNFSFSDNSDFKAVKVFNMLGEVVGSYHIKNKKPLDLSYLAKGVYFLHIQDEVTKKIILF